VQVALQTGHDLAVLRCIAQFADQAIAMVEQVLAFLDEDVDQLAVVDSKVELIGFGFRFGFASLCGRTDGVGFEGV